MSNEVKIINLMPHSINIVAHKSYINKDKEPRILVTILPSGIVARVHQEFKEIDKIQYLGIPIQVANLKFTGVTGVPPVKRNTLYAVSKLVAEALLGERDDLIIMYGLFKQNGKVIGCRSFTKL